MNQRLKKHAALLLAVMQIFVLVFVFPVSAASGQDQLVPVVYYGWEEIKDGMEIPENAWLTVRYEYTAERGESAAWNLTPPAPLIPADDSTLYDVYAVNSAEKEITVGTVSGQDGGIAVSFTVPELKAEPVDEDPVDEGPVGEDDPDGLILVGGDDDDDFGDDETVTVWFEIPVVFDSAKLSEADEDGNRQETIESGGAQVSVTVTAASVSGFLGEPLDSALPLWSDLETYFELLKNSSTVTGNTSITTTDMLTLYYEFEIKDDGVNDWFTAIKDAVAADGGVTYTVPVPAGLVDFLEWPTTDSIEILENTSHEQFATLTVHPGGTITITFEGDFWSGSLTDLMGDFEVEFQVDTEYLEHLGHNRQVTIDGVTFTVKIPGEGNDPLTKAETGYDKTTGTITWTIKYTPGENDNPSKIIDTFDTTYQTFVAGSLKYSNDNTNWTGIADSAHSSGTITIPLYDSTGSGSGVPYTVGQPLYIQYQTKLTQTAFNELWSGNTTKTLTVENKVNVYDSGDVKIFENDVVARYTVKQTDEVNLVKNGTYSSTSGLITWTLTVHTNGCNVTNLVVHDAIPQYLENITITKVTGNGADIGTSSVDLSTSGLCGVNDCTAEFVIGTPGYEDYVITYTTEINDDVFENSLTTGSSTSTYTFKNNAWLTFDWSGVGTGFKTPTFAKDVGVDTRLIRKAGYGTYASGITGYDSANGTIQWRITVNPHKVNIESGSITDTILTDGLQLKGYDISGYNYVANGSIRYQYANGQSPVIEFISYDSTTKEIEFTISGTLNTTAYIYIVTEITDQSKWEYNHSTTKYENKVDISATVTGATNDPVTDTDTASVTPVSEVLAKSGVYDYVNNIITWTVTVNKNKMAMENVELTDTLTDGLDFVPGSVEFTKPLSNSFSEADNVDYTGKTLTIALGNINDMVEITFKTTVNVDQYEGFKVQANTFDITNKITLTRDDMDDQDFTGKVTITNNILSKSGKLATTSDNRVVIEYTVEVNPHMLDLSGLTLEDDLPDGVFLDSSTVELYYATVTSIGALEKSDAVPASEWSMNYNSADNIFTVNLPDGQSGYILYYSCVIKNPNSTTISSYKNSVHFFGSEITAGSSEEITSKSVRMKGSATSTLVGQITAALTITKTDSMRGYPLSDIEFELLMVDGSEFSLVETLATDRDGRLTFNSLLAGKTYALREVSTEDYSNPVVVAENGSDIELLLADYRFAPSDSDCEIAIENDPATADITIHKRSAGGALLNGAVFTLTTDVETGGFTETEPGSGKYSRTDTSVNGVVTFDKVPFGTYVLKETKAPSGYWDNNREYSVTVTTSGTYTVSYNGTALTGNIVVNYYDDGGVTPPVEPEGPKDPEKPDPKDPEDPKDPGDDDEDPVIPPGVTPHDGDNTFVWQDDGSLLEIDPEGVPIGRWYQDENNVWIFDEFPPLAGGDMPQTGGFPGALLLLTAGAASIGAGVWIRRKKPGKAK